MENLTNLSILRPIPPTAWPKRRPAERLFENVADPIYVGAIYVGAIGSKSKRGTLAQVGRNRC